MRLIDVPLGVRVPVHGVVGDSALQTRMAELGIRPGASISCGRRCAGGGRIIVVGNARLALDRAALGAIEIGDPDT
jgi:Fe2+ transport system protein FeoA